jgi:UDP-glucose 4-epimerase
VRHNGTSGTSCAGSHTALLQGHSLSSESYDGNYRVEGVCHGRGRFHGTDLVDRLVDVADSTVVFGDLRTGSPDNLAHAMRIPEFRFVRDTLLDFDPIAEALRDCSLVIHLAANTDVITGVTDPRIDFEQNLLATRNLLEAMRTSRRAKDRLFASTSTVYAEAKRFQ